MFMKLPRRNFLHLVTGAVALPVVSSFAWAQGYPTRPVRIIVGFPAGSAPDVVARLMGQWLSERLGQSFIIDNRTGAGGTLASEAVVRARPDGHTLLLVETSSAMNAALYEKLNYNLIRDIAGVASFMRVQMVIVVHPSFPAKTLPEFIDTAKANPGKINMGSPGNGTPQHVAGELFKMMTGVAMTHVPYRGGPPALSDLIGGQIQMMPGTVLLVLEHAEIRRPSRACSH
jgi:tripartite-type tricarboxylate transporter receptor subunit TctC